MNDPDPWPPEGTRVRITKPRLFSRTHDGLLEKRYGHYGVSIVHHSPAMPTWVAVERHEIEVIDGQ